MTPPIRPPDDTPKAAQSQCDTLAKPVLHVENLRVEFALKDGAAPVIDGVSLTLKAGARMSLVGESGCGKSMTALAIMGLLPQPMARIAEGGIWLDGEDLTKATPQRMREIRGNDISMIFQEPMTSLNPVYTVGRQIAEVLRRHRAFSKKQADVRAVELLEAVQIPDPHRRQHAYPHELSGGQRQRVMIAMALACEPRLLIADEPTTALDVTVQAEIFELLMTLHREISTAILLITHDMGAVCQLCEEMSVMYAGRVVEAGPVAHVMGAPAHPYTRGLINCVPHVQDHVTAEEIKPLVEIPGLVPPLNAFGQEACMFAPRCGQCLPQCQTSQPTPVQISQAHQSWCFANISEA